MSESDGSTAGGLHDSDTIKEIIADDTLGLDIVEKLHEEIVGRAVNIEPGNHTETAEVGATSLQRFIPRPGRAEYDDVWLHIREDSSLAVTAHLKPILDGDGKTPPTDSMTYEPVIDWGDDRPNQALVNCAHLAVVIEHLPLDDVDTVTVHLDDSGLVAFDCDAMTGGFVVAPRQTAEHPNVSKQEIAELRQEKEGKA